MIDNIFFILSVSQDLLPSSTSRSMCETSLHLRAVRKKKTQQCHIKHASRKYICCGSKCYILIIRRYYLCVTTLKSFPFAIICYRIKSFVITTTRWRAAWKMCNLVILEWNNLLLHSTLFKYWLKLPAWLHYCQATALCAELLSLTCSPSITHVFLI